MTDNELRKLNRKELLEILLEQTNEIERLSKELAEANEKLASREISIDKCGSIAEASLALSGIFDSAQAAADQYLENIRINESLCMHKIDEANAEAEKIIAIANNKATEILRNAEAEGESYLVKFKEIDEKYKNKLLSAQYEADRIIAEAENKAGEKALKAKEDADSYWKEAEFKLNKFYQEHQEIKALLDLKFGSDT